MKFEWDGYKAAANQRKHGVPFASRVFLDNSRLEWIDTRPQHDEPGWIAIGLVDGMEIVVAYVPRGCAILLISARKAEQHEREDYWTR
jgi:uncharacterized DUF497 family protein